VRIIAFSIRSGLIEKHIIVSGNIKCRKVEPENLLNGNENSICFSP